MHPRSRLAKIDSYIVAARLAFRRAEFLLERDWSTRARIKAATLLYHATMSVDNAWRYIQGSELPHEKLTKRIEKLDDLSEGIEVLTKRVGEDTESEREYFTLNDPSFRERIPVPAKVRTIAARALAWRSTFKRGGTSVGLHTARLLATKSSIPLAKVRHILRYFPRHEVDKRAPGFYSTTRPSNGRIAWDLWGGDEGWRWAKHVVALVDRKK